MVSSPELLEWYNAGLQAFQSKQYPEAIHHLQTFTQLCVDQEQMGSPSFLQTQMTLVQCYQATQQLEAAIALCEWCCQHPELREWANQTLPILQAPTAPTSIPSDSPPPAHQSPQATPAPQPKASESTPQKQAKVDPESAVSTALSDTPVDTANAEVAAVDSKAEDPSLLEAGVGANRRGNHAEAVKLLDQYLSADLSETSQRFMKAQMTLIKSYISLEQKENAIDRCRQLYNTPNAALQIWINKTLGSLIPPEELHALSTSQESSPSEPPPQEVSSNTIAAPSRTATPSSAARTVSAAPTSSSSATRTVSAAPTSSSAAAPQVSRQPATPQRRSISSKAPGQGFSSDEILPLVGAFILTFIFCFLGFNSILGFFGRIIFFIAIAIGVGTATQGVQKLVPTGIGLFFLAIIPFTGITFDYFFGWAIGATVMSFLLRVSQSERSDTVIPLINPKSIRMTIALGLGFILSLIAPHLLGIAVSNKVSNLQLETLETTVGMESGVTPLHIAAGQGDLDQVQTLLVSSGTDVNARDLQGRTPLHWAASGCVWQILNESAQGYQCNGSPTQVEVVNLLIRAGSDVNAVDTDESETPLHWAVEWGSPETVQALLTNGANPNPIGSFDSPLSLAEERGDEEITKLLQQHGAK